MKMTSGVSLPIVSAFSTRLLCRMPRTLMAAIAAMMTVITTARRPGCVTAGQ